MQSTQEIVELILDSNRNALLTLDLKVIATLFDPLTPLGDSSRHRIDLYYNDGIRRWHPPRRFVRDERTWPSDGPQLRSDMLRKAVARFAVDITLRGAQLCVLSHERFIRCVCRGLLHVCYPKVWTLSPLFSDSRLLTEPVVTSRLRQIRKVGPLSDSKSTPTRRPWIPLPLRRRTTNDWL